MSADKLIVIRDVAEDEYHNFLHRDVVEGEVFYRFTGPTYGCIDAHGGVAPSERPDVPPFFEFPADALRPATSEEGTEEHPHPPQDDKFWWSA